MKKKLLRAAAALMAAVLLTGCSGGESSSSGGGPVNIAPAAKEVTPPFWVVEDADTGGTLYLLGSMHAGVEGVQYPDYVMEAYRACDTVAAELDTVAVQQDTEALIEATQCLLLQGTTAKEVMGEDLYNRAVEFMTGKGTYFPAMDMYIPFYWASSLSQLLMTDAGLSAAYGTEAIFLESAHTDGKTVVEIESAAEQYGMMAGIPMEMQLYTLETSIGDANYQMQVASMLALYNAWSSFDTQYLGSLNADGSVLLPEELKESYGIYWDMMYCDRQVKMAEKAVELLKSGEDVFMFVGAAHFYIEDDLITLIEREGYTVEEIRGAALEEKAA